MEFWGQKVVSIFNLGGNCHTVFRGGRTISCPLQHHTEVPVASRPHQLLEFSGFHIFNSSHVNGYEVVPCSLDLHFPND